MIWLNLSKAENLLKQGTYSNTFIFKYILIYTLFYSFTISWNYNLNEYNYGMRFLFLGIIVLIKIGSIYLLFNVNQKGDQKNFLDRLFVLGWIVFFRLFLLSLASLSAGLIILKFLKTDQVLDEFQIKIPFYILFSLGYYYFLYHSFRRVAL
ncbi:MAG: hypothetical protein VW080_09975 [Flavobacteriaceae bacterium]